MSLANLMASSCSAIVPTTGSSNTFLPSYIMVEPEPQQQALLLEDQLS